MQRIFFRKFSYRFGTKPVDIAKSAAARKRGGIRNQAYDE